MANAEQAPEINDQPDPAKTYIPATSSPNPSRAIKSAITIAVFTVGSLSFP